jgi:hypothetical protein
MTEEKWQETLGEIKDKFKVIEEGRRDLEGVPRGFVEFIVFEGPMGRIKLERTTQPVVLDKKTIYSKLAGTASKVEYIFSETETFSKLRAYRFNEIKGDWEEIKGYQS